MRSVKTVDRVVAILEAFSTDAPRLTVGEIAKRVGLDKSVVSRILATLRTRQYVRQDPKTKEYTLGLKVFELAASVLRHLDVRTVALPVMAGLAKQLRESVLLTVLDGHEAVCVEKIDSDHAVRCTSYVGKRTPIYAGAVTKVLMAFLSEEEIDEIIAGGLVAFTPHTIVDAVALKQQLAAIRENGYCVTCEEMDLGSIAIGVPIRDHTGKVIAAVSVVAPLFRLSREEAERVAPIVKEAGKEISRGLGWSG